ncbi:hypothetical protein KKHLCK_09255 [Candidatus Electrothrix laxa]
MISEKIKFFFDRIIDLVFGVILLFIIMGIMTHRLVNKKCI